MSSARPTVDQTVAGELLREAIARANGDPSEIPVTKWDIEIRTIIQGKHLTFRYILVTGLLAKATNPNINALALQAKANVEGAYDARSLCHGVIVPIERQLLNSLLGGSNEPFLNKPARFPTISPSNPVRAGEDRELLLILHKVLSEVETKDEAFNSLCTAMRYTFARQRQTVSNEHLSQLSESADSHLKIIEFIDAFVNRSIEGQVAAIVTGTVLSMYFDQIVGEGGEVIVHPVNQSGASSNEVADIDIKINGEIFVVLEVKDKRFTWQDADHAASKAWKYGLNSISFIIGANGVYDGDPSLENVAKDIFHNRGVNVVFIDLCYFVKSVIALCPDLDFATFLEKLQCYANKARVKDEVFEHINDTFQSIQGTSNPPSINSAGAD